MRKELTLLREQMKKHRIDAWMITGDDFHGSEYAGDYFKTRKYISGFTGSAGTLVILQDMAGLWTDGRYFLQAERELKDSGIDLYKSGQPGVPTVIEFLLSHLENGQVLGFDGRCVMAATADQWKNALRKKNVKVNGQLDLAGNIWENRPAMSKEPVWELSIKYAGQSRAEKIAAVRKNMAEKGADYFLLAALEDICWLLNVRGKDINCTPVVLGYLLMSAEGIIWYVQKEALSEAIKTSLTKDGIKTAPYDRIYEDVKKLPGGSAVLYDANCVNMSLRDAMGTSLCFVEEENPTLMLKAVKNPVEVDNERMAHILDGAAVTRFIYWLKTHTAREEITELDAEKRLEEYRKQHPHYLGQSFSSIIAAGEHGAVIHYSATSETNALLSARGFVLADVGGHYLEGTTDTTRTIALGPLTEKEKELYTAVLRGHINLSSARFLKGCTGLSLDGLARTPLWEKGYDYNHGTGHGVGYLLSVHEGPNAFRYRSSGRKKGECILEEGMITSNEPGVYLEGEFGIRLENMIVCVKDRENGFGRFLKFEPLTMVPFDLDAIKADQMTEKEIRWLNAYHNKVYETLAPYLEEEEKLWLRQATREIKSTPRQI